MNQFFTPELTELVKILGFGMAITVVWILTIRFFDRVLVAQQNQFDKMLAQFETQYGKMIDELSKHNTENHSVLNKFAESIDFTNGLSAQLQSDIANNNFCPIVREGKRK